MLAPTRSLLRYWRSLEKCSCSNTIRPLTTSATSHSGHSRWSTIKHDKAKKDASKTRQRTLLSKEIEHAVKTFGPNPDTNPRLALAIANAKRASFPKASIESIILRGQGKSSSGAPLEPLTIEAVVPPVALIIECQTDSKLRALQDLRLLLKNHGGSPTPTAYLFEKRGRVLFRAQEGVGVDEALEAALESGAVDVNVDEDGRVVVDTEAGATKPAEERLAKELGLEVESAETIWVPNAETMVSSLPRKSLVELEKLQEELEDYPGVQGVYINLELEKGEEEPTST